MFLPQEMAMNRIIMKRGYGGDEQAVLLSETCSFAAGKLSQRVNNISHLFAIFGNVITLFELTVIKTI